MLLGDALQYRFDVIDPPFELSRPLEHRSLGGLEDAVQTTQDGEGQDDPPVLGLLVVTSEKVGHRPDEGRMVLDGRLCHARACPSPLLVPFWSR